MHQTFKVGDVVGKYTVLGFAGTQENPRWEVRTESGNEGTISEESLRAAFREATLTPEYINGLSASAYAQLVREVGEEKINRVMKRSVAKPSAPENFNSREITSKWFAARPQIPRTRNNTRLFDEYLAKMPNPNFTSEDFDRAFADLFLKLELNPQAAGIVSFGDAIRGETAINELSSIQIKQLQKSFPVVAPVDFDKLTLDQILVEVGKKTTSKEFDAFTKQVDQESGIKAPVPPLLAAAREKIWSGFFETHPRLVPSEETKTKLLDLLKAKSNFNPSAESLPVLHQYLDAALEFLIQSGGEVEVYLESNIHSAGATRWQVNEPRPIGAPIPRFDDTPVEVTLADIDAMPAAEYANKSLNPAFRQAVDRLTARFAG